MAPMPSSGPAVAPSGGRRDHVHEQDHQQHPRRDEREDGGLVLGPGVGEGHDDRDRGQEQEGHHARDLPGAGRRDEGGAAALCRTAAGAGARGRAQGGVGGRSSWSRRPVAAGSALAGTGVPRATWAVANATVTATAAMTMSPTTSRMIWSADTHYLDTRVRGSVRW